ncbi:MAG: hypothetical protein EZS28_046443 [Streblomastix strix]|uniref:Uncharacterized protein n=1 Tax=Streblomastix strix TaxID=222440 RepID=A0A5J4TJQ6_9EUKA|nr:MAG: hypothetical protein EZS28_046443 [Streblomastix strix]
MRCGRERILYGDQNYEEDEEDDEEESQQSIISLLHLAELQMMCLQSQQQQFQLPTTSRNFITQQEYKQDLIQCQNVQQEFDRQEDQSIMDEDDDVYEEVDDVYNSDDDDDDGDCLLIENLMKIQTLTNEKMKIQMMMKMIQMI